MSKRNFSILAVIVLISIGLILYGNTLGNEFIWDDHFQITGNDYVKNFEVAEIFKTNIVAGAGRIGNLYRPLVTLSFATDYQLWGANPSGFHLTNIFTHIFSAILVFLILSLLQPNKFISFLTSIVFLIHPVQTEAVTYIAGRTDLFPAFFSPVVPLSVY